MSDIVQTKSGVHLIWRLEYTPPEPYMSSDSEEEEEDLSDY